jgi:hypothetical protein
MRDCDAMGVKCVSSNMPVGPPGHRLCRYCRLDVHCRCCIEDEVDIHSTIFTCLNCLAREGSTGTTVQGARMSNHARLKSHRVVPKSAKTKSKASSSSSRKPASSAAAAAVAVDSEIDSNSRPKKKQRISRATKSGKDDLQQLYSHFIKKGERGTFCGVHRSGPPHNHPPCICTHCDQAYEDAKASAQADTTIVSGASPNCLPRLSTLPSTTDSSFFPYL